MTEFQFLLNDRITKIQSIDESYNLRENAYLSFSGGKDSCVLSKLLDLALPNNKIPRVFLNTGIEYVSMVKFVRNLAEKDSRIVIVNSGVNIPEMLKTDGYPFKSKEHSQFVHDFQNGKNETTVQRYMNKAFMGCPQKLKYQFTSDFSLKISDKCCQRLKKEPAKKWAKENNKTISITGIKKEEKGLRWNKDSCTIFQSGNLKKFHPLMPVDESFINEFIKQYNVQLLELYYEPFNFERTGCKGCPFNPNLRKDLEIMKKFMPTEATNCEKIWGPVYTEYRRLGFRLFDNFQKGIQRDIETKEENGITLYRLTDVAFNLGITNYVSGKVYTNYFRCGKLLNKKTDKTTFITQEEKEILERTKQKQEINNDLFEK